MSGKLLMLTRRDQSKVFLVNSDHVLTIDRFHPGSAILLTNGVLVEVEEDPRDIHLQWDRTDDA